jgi:hypothetical protein
MADKMPAKDAGLEPSASSERWNLPRSFTTSAAALSALLLVLLACFTDYSSENATDEHVRQYYMFYIHVAIMVFIGLGYLMSFLRSYGYSAVALNFFASALVMLEYIVVGGAVHQKVSDAELLAHRSTAAVCARRILWFYWSWAPCYGCAGKCHNRSICRNHYISAMPLIHV